MRRAESSRRRMHGAHAIVAPAKCPRSARGAPVLPSSAWLLIGLIHRVGPPGARVAAAAVRRGAGRVRLLADRAFRCAGRRDPAVLAAPRPGRRHLRGRDRREHLRRHRRRRPVAAASARSRSPAICPSSASIIWALLRLPSWQRTRGDWIRFGLDACVVLVTGGTFVWYFSMKQPRDLDGTDRHLRRDVRNHDRRPGLGGHLREGRVRRRRPARPAAPCASSPPAARPARWSAG